MWKEPEVNPRDEHAIVRCTKVFFKKEKKKRKEEKRNRKKEKKKFSGGMFSCTLQFANFFFFNK
jgi:hypothetical protein